MKAESQHPNGAGGCHSGIERSYRRVKSCESLVYRTGQGRHWLRQHSSYTHYGMFLVLLPRSTPGSRLTKDSTANKPDCVELGLLCADICQALDRGTNGKKQDELSQSVYGAINQLSV